MIQLLGDGPLSIIQSTPLPPEKMTAGLPLGPVSWWWVWGLLLSHVSTPLSSYFCFVPLFLFTLCLSLLFLPPSFCFSLSIFPLFACLPPSRHTRTPDHLGTSGSVSRDWISLLWLHPFPLDEHIPSLMLRAPLGCLTCFPSSANGCKFPSLARACRADCSVLPFPLPTGLEWVGAT